jgi:hypothetical protein
MRTTLDLPDHLLVIAKQRAAAEHTSLRDIIAEALAQFLNPVAVPASTRFCVPVLPAAAGGMLPGIDPTDSSTLLDLA